MKVKYDKSVEPIKSAVVNNPLLELLDALEALLAERCALQEGQCDDESEEMAKAREVLKKWDRILRELRHAQS